MTEDEIAHRLLRLCQLLRGSTDRRVCERIRREIDHLLDRVQQGASPPEASGGASPGL